jgi:hypothetical protein
MALTETSGSEPSADTGLREQRRALPDHPGVYLFRDAKGRVIYVGKAKSVRKRVASHFSGGEGRLTSRMLGVVPRRRRIDAHAAHRVGHHTRCGGLMAMTVRGGIVGRRLGS